MGSDVPMLDRPGASYISYILSPDYERYRHFVCPRHPPIARPCHPVVFPPELLINIFIEIASDYLKFVFLSEIQDDDEMEARLAVNPFLSILQVSRQFRGIAFGMIEEVFGIREGTGGSLPEDAWAGFRYVVKYIHLLQRGTSEALEEHVKGGSVYSIPSVLWCHMSLTKLGCSSGDDELFAKAREEIQNELGRLEKIGQLSTTHAVLQRDFLSYSGAGQLFGYHSPVYTIIHAREVLWSLQFRHYTITPFAPLLQRITPGSRHASEILRSIYGTLYILGQFHVEALSAKPFPRRAIECYGNRPLVPFPVPVPEAVNPDLIVRHDLVRMLWQFQSHPIILADKGLMEISQSLLDCFVAISMPDRPLTCKVPLGRTQRRRASFSAVQEVRAKPRPSYRQPCHCERRLFVL